MPAIALSPRGDPRRSRAARHAVQRRGARVGNTSPHALLRSGEHATTDTTADTGAKGDSVGDILTFANEVFDGANAKVVGTDNGYCARTAVGKAYECFWTTFLDKGQITVEGPFYDAGPSTLAITGGTGDYANAHGTMDLKARNPKGTEYDFVFHISS
jgi:allene oxide cyclase